MKNMRIKKDELTKGFTLVELLVVIAVLGVLATIMTVVLNPSGMLSEGRDTTRISDMTTLDRAIALYHTSMVVDSKDPYLGEEETVYVSLPDDDPNCASHTLPTLDEGWEYRCVPESQLFHLDGEGWVPIDFTEIRANPIPTLPVDPVNTAEGGFYYTYVTGSWEMTAKPESDKHKDRLEEGKVVYQVGARRGITPLPVLEREGSGGTGGSGPVPQQFARPVDDVTTGDWEVPPLHEKVGTEEPNDASFIYSRMNPSGGSQDTTELLLSDLDVPSEGASHTLRYRARKDQAGGRKIHLTLQLRDGASVIAEYSHTNISHTFSLEEIVLSQSEVDLIEDYTDLRVRIVASSSGAPQGRRAEISWIELDVQPPQ